MDFPVHNKRKTFILNGFGCAGQQKNKSGSSSNKYVFANKVLKIQWFDDLWKPRTLVRYYFGTKKLKKQVRKGVVELR